MDKLKEFIKDELENDLNAKGIYYIDLRKIGALKYLVERETDFFENKDLSIKINKTDAVIDLKELLEYIN